MMNFKDILALIAFAVLVAAGVVWMSAPDNDWEFKAQLRAIYMATGSGLYLLAYVLWQIIAAVAKPRV